MKRKATSRKSKYNNHISRHAKLISSELAKNFDVTDNLVDAALEGNTATLVQLGQLKRDADFASLVLPAAEEAIIAHYQATEDYNRVKANIIKQGAKSGSAIRKLRGQTILTNQKYSNEAKENRLNTQLQSHAEKNRHSFAMLLARAKSQMDLYLKQTDQQATIQQLANQPEIKQIDANYRYRMEATKHYLANGDDANLGLIPKKQYSKSNLGEKTSWLNKLRGLVTK